MATIAQHCEDCRCELGEAFEHVHLWLDEFQPEYGPGHRVFRHHTDGVERVRARWGDAAAHAAEIHISRDCGGQILSPVAYRRRWGLEAASLAPDTDAE